MKPVSLRWVRKICLVAALLLAFASAAWATDLRVGLAQGANSADPHFFNGYADKALALHVYSRLVEQTADTKLEPGLALSWRALSDTVWQFKLRPGVVFHDGTPLTADDVVFSFARAPNVPNSPASFAPVLRTVASVEFSDPLTLLIHTTRPNPNLPGDLANIAIISRHAGEGATSADYNSGRAAIGTGPYKQVSFAAGEGAVLERNPAWFGPPPAWDRVIFRVIPNAGSRTAALLAGDVDLIDAPSLADLPRLRQDPRITIASAPGTRMFYARFDRSRTANLPSVTDLAGNPLAANPFNDLRVRKALSIAINRPALAERVMAGTVTPTGQWLAPGVYSYNPAIPVPAYDPDGARALLTEAGYKDGFKLTIQSSTYSEALQAVASMWSRVGVRTSLEMLPTSVFSSRAARQEFAASSGSWGSNSGEAGYFLVNVVNSYDKERGLGPLNWTRYSNPELDALTEHAMSTIDDTAREVLLRQAEKLAMDDVAVIPLFQLVNFWASRRGIIYAARADERTVAMSARPAP